MRQVHFTLPGSVQRFQVLEGGKAVLAEQEVDKAGNTSLTIRTNRLGSAIGKREISTWSFTSQDIVGMKIYDMMALKLLYLGLAVHAYISLPNNAAGNPLMRLKLPM